MQIQTGMPVPISGLMSSAARVMKIGDSILCDPKQAASLANALRYIGRQPRRRKEGDRIRVWYAADRAVGDSGVAS
jgi:hypothetical protein